MAGDFTIYDQAAVGINGSLLIEATSVGLTYIDSDEAIALLALTINDAPRRGVVVAPGGRMLSVDVAEHRPIAGATVDILELYLDVIESTLTVVLLGSGETLTTKGFVTKPTVTAGVGESLVTKWSFIGYAAKFETA